MDFGLLRDVGQLQGLGLGLGKCLRGSRFKVYGPLIHSFRVYRVYRPFRVQG